MAGIEHENSLKTFGVSISSDKTRLAIVLEYAIAGDVDQLIYKYQIDYSPGLVR